MFRQCYCTVYALLIAAIAALSPLSAYAKPASVTGLVFTVGSDRVQTVWPNARVTLRNLDTNNSTAADSNDLGVYIFTEVPSGSYQVSVSLSGFKPVSRRITVEKSGVVRVDFQLALLQESQTVTVNAEGSRLNTTSSSGDAPSLNEKTLKSLVQLNQDFQDALPLLPGVVRGLDGQIHIKGGRTNQANTLVNSASVADAFTGQPALTLPTVAIHSVQVLSNPFSSEYGQFASGVVNVDTRGGTDQWKWLFEDPVPRFRWLYNSTHGVESASPHLTFAGPLQRGKAWLFQAIGYGYDTVRVPSLPDPDNVRIVEKVNSYTQLDWNPLANQHFTTVLAFDPQDTHYATINTFNPQPVTANDRERDYFLSVTHRWLLQNGGFLQSLFSSKHLDSRIYPATQEPQLTLYPEVNSGTYFELQQRDTQLYQWFQTLHIRPLKFAGRHLPIVGYSWSHASYLGHIANFPVQVLREDHTLSSTINFADGSLGSHAATDDYAIFVQDNWQLHPRLSLDLGLRFDRAGLSSRPVIAPRIGFVFAPTGDEKTAIRGGFGVFYDKIPLNIAVFDRIPAQTITFFAADGNAIVDGPTSFTHVAPVSLRVPRSLGWTLQVDRQIREGLFIRLGYEERHSFQEFFVTPSQPGAASPRLSLLNSGHQDYRELLGMVRWKVSERTTLFASYVHSRAEGELNDYNRFFGNYPYPLIRPNQFGPLDSDAPNRGLFWDIIGLPWKLTFIPILDVHTGFPFSRLDQNWNFLGAENRAGRLRTFLGLDTKFQYPVDFTFHDHRIQFLFGLSVYNVLNRSNPRDVQQYYASPNYGTFYNSVPRQFRIDGDFNF
jgi:outer membrane receptor protein involved in Fe transport